MVSIAGSKKLKRQMAPSFWGITRKGKRFVVTVHPGAHSKHRSIPSAVLLRDTLGAVSTLREAKKSIYSGNVEVDGVKRTSLHHGIGLMDVVELGGTGDIYRMVPSGGAILKPVKIEAAEKDRKICRVTSKTSISGGRTQIGFHDGRSLISDEKVSVGDSCLVQVPGQKILKVARMEKGAHAVVTRGTNAGSTGTISGMQDGTFTLSRMATLDIGGREIKIPTDMLLVVGADGPLIRIQ
ncbi:ribosomal protein S4E [Cenarchaeum symbiosum A]|uniref:Small ribosomal subunit protein eS4 n=1 Tax=Cenarchaeum symbiosum (strain A) TaxID=414004 RepID=A0RVY5_CENSY|nr:ribosomal protein S4E [Cenarchaeum symbiosum A]